MTKVLRSDCLTFDCRHYLSYTCTDPNDVSVGFLQRKIYIWDRNGQLYDEIHLGSVEYEDKTTSHEEKVCASAMEWDHTGERLGICPTGTSTLVLYSVGTRETSQIDVTMRVRPAPLLVPQY